MDNTQDRSADGLMQEAFVADDGTIQATVIGRSIPEPQTGNDRLSLTQMLQQAFVAADGAFQIVLDEGSSGIPFVEYTDLADGDLLKYSAADGEWVNFKNVEANVEASDVTLADSAGYYTGTEVESALAIVGKSRAVSAHYSGFPSLTDTALAWDDTTYTLTLTASSDSIWIAGVEYTISTLTKQLSVAQEATSGVYWFWITAPAGVPQINCDTAAPGFDKCLVATVYWNTTTSKGILGDERHWFGRDQKYHEYLHQTVGARYASGMAGTFGDTTVSIEAGEFYDEDIEHVWTTAQTTVKVLYHNGDNDWAWDVLTTPYKVVNPGVDNTLRYNNGTALASAANNRFVNQWVFCSPDEEHPIHIVIGTAEYANIALARAASLPSLGGLDSPEVKLIYKITYKNDGGTPDFIEATDFRTASNLPTAAYLPTSHAALSNLAYATSGHSGFEPTLVSGVSIKTVNSESLLGPGDLVVDSGGILNGYDTVLAEYKDAATITVKAGGQFVNSDSDEMYTVAADTDVGFASNLSSDVTGGEAASTLYFVWGGEDAGGALEFWLNDDATTMPSELVKGKLLKMVVANDASSNIIPFAFDGRRYSYETAIATGGSDLTEVLDAAVSNAAFVDVDCSGFVHPSARFVDIVHAYTTTALVRRKGDTHDGVTLLEGSGKFPYRVSVDSSQVFQLKGGASETHRISVWRYYL